MRIAAGALAGLLLACLPAPAVADCLATPNPELRSRYRFPTPLGTFCVELLDQPGEAPLTAENFRGYVERGDYENGFLHRSIPGFVLQGGGFAWTPEEGYQRIPQQPPVANEPNLSNLRGTLAMAKLGGQPDSATNQWFVNLADNTHLDTQNGGFTAFARVYEGMDVVDALAALPTEWGPGAIDDPLAPVFSNLPVLELLERDPAGYGCGLVIEPNPDANGIPSATWPPACASQADIDAALLLTVAALDPQVPPRLVSVPEPGAPAQAALGAALLLAAARLRRPR